ncbi:MAG: amylo-alpha-1,6-glucosidase [Micrococcales bacterium]|nr:amylo-alpha-1,6-glucosidase [Micrococcales bacterium]
MESLRQPLLHDASLTLRAPAQSWSRADGTMGGGVDGVYLSDVRIASSLDLRVAGSSGEHIATASADAAHVVATALLRELDEAVLPDPGVRLELHRTATADGAEFRIRVVSRQESDLRLPIAVRLLACADPVDRVKADFPSRPVSVTVGGTRASWAGEGIEARLDAPGARIALGGAELALAWGLVVPARGSAEVRFALTATDAIAVVEPDDGPALELPARAASTTDDRMRRWLGCALGDLDALRMRRRGSPHPFLAAGAPWFLTLFGRDAIWSARLMLPADRGLRIATGTLRVLAELQGTHVDPATAEQPGKILHELRRSTQTSELHGFQLPPLYYGTVDATPLWICLLHETWRAGLPLEEVRVLQPALEAALGWMRDFGDSDGDGLLEYVDETGHGLANQGWKDSGDSVQWRDGRLAEGPIALCEVQAYAHQAAVLGAELLDALGAAGGDGWRAWAGALRARFAETFWVRDARGRYPAIALDARKRPVDALTSNIGHLLGTGILSPEDEAIVADRLVSPELSSGYGLRTMSTLEAGYWPLSYHGGSVWTHDTAIVVRGLAASGFAAEARTLAEGLLAAAPAFEYRMPELHGGDAASTAPTPIPYPAACRPQAGSAAAAVAVWDALGR